MGGLLRNQADISAQVPMPTDRVDDASVSNTVAAETLTWLYVTASAWASATGQAAGTVVVGKLVYNGILDSLGSAVGNVDNTSFAFAAATRFDTKISIPEDKLAALVYMSPTNQKLFVSTYLTTNGMYAIDHRRGLIWGIPKAVVADDTVSYKYGTPITGGGAGDKVDIIKWGGTATTLGQKAMAASVPVVISSDQSAVTVDTELPAAGALQDALANPTTTGVGAFLSGYNGTTWDRLRTGMTGVVTTVLGYLNVLNVGRYNATALTLSDTNYVNTQMDVNGNTQVNQRTLTAGEDLSNNVVATSNRKLASPSYAPLVFTNFGANATLNVKASAGNVFSVYHHNLNAAARYFQIHNTATVPGGAAVPLMTFLVPAGASIVLGEDFFSQAGLNFTTGIAFAHSTTEGTYTAGTAGDQFTQIQYI